jgi:phosphoribosylanthranilate isomerase
MLVKVCGLTEKNQLDAISAFTDFSGMIFYAKSPRFLAGIIDGNEGNRVGVFVDETEQTIRKTAATHSLDILQLHGSETPELCKSLGKEFKIIKAFGINESFDFDSLHAYNSIDFFLFDTQTKNHGGSGVRFKWNLLDNYQLNIPFILSGGIGPEHLSEIKTINHKQFAGIDLNSRFEVEPGIKDIKKLKEFIHELRHNLHTA